MRPHLILASGSPRRRELLTDAGYEFEVVSARVDLKQACARAERALERYAEPLQALYGAEWPSAFLDVAWSRVGHNIVIDDNDDTSAIIVTTVTIGRLMAKSEINIALSPRRWLVANRLHAN